MKYIHIIAFTPNFNKVLNNKLFQTASSLLVFSIDVKSQRFD